MRKLLWFLLIMWIGTYAKCYLILLEYVFWSYLNTTDHLHYVHTSCKIILYTMLLQLVKTIKNAIDVSERAFRITFFMGKKKREIRLFLSKITLQKCLTTYTHTHNVIQLAALNHNIMQISLHAHSINLYTDSVLLTADIFTVVPVFY